MWWKGEHVIKQTLDVAIPIFETTFGPGYQALFLFDNATGHTAFAPDALRANVMNLEPGRKQAYLRDGWYFESISNDTNTQKIQQSMTFALDDMSVPENWRGKPKGINAILKERGLWPKDEKLRLDCKTKSDKKRSRASRFYVLRKTHSLPST